MQNAQQTYYSLYLNCNNCLLHGLSVYMKVQVIAILFCYHYIILQNIHFEIFKESRHMIRTKYNGSKYGFKTLTTKKNILKLRKSTSIINSLHMITAPSSREVERAYLAGPQMQPPVPKIILESEDIHSFFLHRM